MTVPTGFVGLGLMGVPMARNLTRAGYPLTVWNRTRARADVLAEEGVGVVHRPRDLGGTVDVVLTMVSDHGGLEEVLFGADGVVQGMPAGGLILNLSTTSPDAVRSVHHRLGERGISLVDAPVFGSVEAAEAGDLEAVVGAEEEDLDRVRGHLDAMCSAVFHMGPVGAGSLMKICGNLVGCGMVGLLGESLSIGRSAGLDPQRMLEVISAIDFSSPTYDEKGQLIIRGDYAARFPLRHALKDTRTALALGAATGLDLRVTRGVAAELASAAQRGFDDEDLAAIIKGIPERPKRVS